VCSNKRNKRGDVGCFMSMVACLFGQQPRRQKCHIKPRIRTAASYCFDCSFSVERHWRPLRNQFAEPGRRWHKLTQEPETKMNDPPLTGARDNAVIGDSATEASFQAKINLPLPPLPPAVQVPLDRRWGEEFYHYPWHIASRFPPCPPPKLPLPLIPPEKKLKERPQLSKTVQLGSARGKGATQSKDRPIDRSGSTKADRREETPAKKHVEYRLQNLPQTKPVKLTKKRRPEGRAEKSKPSLASRMPRLISPENQRLRRSTIGKSVRLTGRLSKEARMADDESCVSWACEDARRVERRPKC
jgi:hypothetical protein